MRPPKAGPSCAPVVTSDALSCFMVGVTKQQKEELVKNEGMSRKAVTHHYESRYISSRLHPRTMTYGRPAHSGTHSCHIRAAVGSLPSCQGNQTTQNIKVPCNLMEYSQEIKSEPMEDRRKCNMT